MVIYEIFLKEYYIFLREMQREKRWGWGKIGFF